MDAAAADDDCDGDDGDACVVLIALTLYITHTESLKWDSLINYLLFCGPTV